MAVRSTNSRRHDTADSLAADMMRSRASSARDINNGRPDAGTDREIDSTGRGKPELKDSYSKTPNKPPPPGGGKVWDYTNEQWVDMPNLNPLRPWSRTPTGGSRTGDPNERIWHEPGSASGNWSPEYYHWDENGNWVPKPTGRYGMPEDRNGKPIFTPDPIKYPEYFVGGDDVPDTFEQTAAMEERRRALLMSDPAFRAATEAGDRRAQAVAMAALKQRMQEQRFIERGGTAETWRNRFKTQWPVPKPVSGGSTHNPNGAPVSRETSPPPSGRNGGRGGMIEGFLGSGGATEDLPPGATLDIPSQNILSSLRDLAPTSNWKPPTSKPASKPAPRGVRRGGGRVD